MSNAIELLAQRQEIAELNEQIDYINSDLIVTHLMLIKMDSN
jgi:hypothetical protein